jgi:hypothetical protein
MKKKYVVLMHFHVQKRQLFNVFWNLFEIESFEKEHIFYFDRKKVKFEPLDVDFVCVQKVCTLICRAKVIH